MESTKIDELTISVDKTETKTTTATYTKDYLLTQKENILAQKAREIALRDAELAEINSLLAACVTLGIKTQAEVEVVKKTPVEEVVIG